MATEVLELVIRVQGSNAAVSEVDRMTKSANALTGALRLMRNALVGISFFKAFEELTSGISQMQQLNNLLTTVTKTAEDQAAAFQLLGRAANEVRANMDPFVKFFTTLERSTAGYKLTTEDAIKTTQAFFATFAISGLDDQSIRNVTRDMKEVFNMGTVQGRIFRAVIMQDQEAALVLSKYIVATGSNAVKVNAELAKMRAKGEQPDIYGGITSGQFRGAFTGGDIQRAFLAGFDEEMRKMNKTTVTLSQSFVMLNNFWLMFLESLNRSTPIFDDLAQAVLYVGENLKGVLEIATALAALLITRYLVLPLAAWFLSVVAAIELTIAKFAIFTFFSIANAIVAVGSFILSMGLGMAATVGLTAALGVGLVVAIGGVVAALAGFFAPLLQLATFGDLLTDNLGGPFKDIKLTLKDLPTIFSAAMDTLVTNWPLFSEAMSAMWDDMLSGMKNSWSDYWLWIENKAIGVAGVMAQLLTPVGAAQWALGGFKFEPGNVQPGARLPTDTAAPYIKTLKDQLAANIVAEKNKPLAVPNISGEGGKPESIAEDPMKALRALEQLTNAVAKFGGPMAKFKKDQIDMQYTIDKAVNVVGNETVALKLLELGYGDYDVQTGTSKKLTEDMRFSVLGMTDAVRDVTDRQAIYNQALATGDVRLEQYNNKAKHLNDILRDLKQVDPSADAGIKSSILKEQLSLMDKFSIAESASTKYVLEDVKAQNELYISLDVLNKAWKAGRVTAEQYNLAVRDIQLTFLATKTDALSGFQSGIIQVQKEMANVATDASKTVVDAFNNMTDALTNFFMTGKFNMKAFVNGMLNDLTRLAVKQNIMGPIANVLGFKDGQNITNSSGGIAGVLSGVFGGAKNQAGALGATADKAVWVQMASADSVIDKLAKDQQNMIDSQMPGVTDALDTGGANAAKSIADAFTQQNGGGGFVSRLLSVFSSMGSNGGNNQWLSSLINIGASAFGSGAITGGATLNSDGMTWTPGRQGFATGGSFMVGGTGGTDSQHFHMRMTPGERVTVETPAQQANSANGGDGRKMMLGELHLHLYGVTDHDSFQRAEGQIYSRAAARLQRAAMRDG